MWLFWSSSLLPQDFAGTKKNYTFYMCVALCIGNLLLTFDIYEEFSPLFKVRKLWCAHFLRKTAYKTVVYLFGHCNCFGGFFWLILYHKISRVSPLCNYC